MKLLLSTLLLLVDTIGAAHYALKPEALVFAALFVVTLPHFGAALSKYAPKAE